MPAQPRRRLLLGAALLAAVPGAAFATVSLTAIRTRVADHPTYVRAVIAFTDGALHAGELSADDPDPLDGRARLLLRHLRARTQAAPATAHGLRVRIDQGTNQLTIRATAGRRRFKYLAYRVLHAPERLALDLWKSAPPPAGADVRRGAGGCLELQRILTPPERITVTGREHGLFEHTLNVVVRAADGRVLARRSVVAAGGRWSTRLTYTVSRRQAGTLEAAAGSPKDGALACLAQARVTLAGAEAAP